MYQPKGQPEERTPELASDMMADKESIPDTLAREKLGIDSEELGGSATKSHNILLSPCHRGRFPNFPIFLLNGSSAIYLSLRVSGTGLFIIAAAIASMTGRSNWFSGLRQVLVGLAAAILTFGIGMLMGVSIF
jgi:hypothetical protein